MAPRKATNIFCLLTFCLLFGWKSDAGAASASLTNFATSITSESVAAIWVAKDRGLFKKYGLDVRFIQMPTSSVAVAALIAGEIDMAVIGPGHLLNAVSAGADVVGIANLVQKLDYRFVSRPEIKTPEDLRGKSIAISGPGAVSHIVALLSLQRLSIDPNQAKIAFLTIPGTEVNRRAALETKKVDATSLNGSVGDLYARRGYTMQFNFKDSGVTMPQTMIVTTRKNIAAKPDIVEGYVKGFVEAIAFLLEPTNKSAVTRIIAANLRLNDATAAEEAYHAVVNSYDRVPAPSADGMKLLHGILGSLNPKLAQVKPESTVDNGLITKLESSGFIQSFYKKP